MKRWFWRLLIAGVFAVVTLGTVGYLTVRASLPEIDGEIAVAGLTGTVTIERDVGGIPTITAGNRPDLAFATGFAHGQDRFFQMDMIRRRAGGEFLFLPEASTPVLSDDTLMAIGPSEALEKFVTAEG